MRAWQYRGNRGRDFQAPIALFRTGSLSSHGWVTTTGFDDAIAVGYPTLRNASAAKVVIEVGGELAATRFSKTNIW
jgi:hypothetical protein